MMSTDTNLEAGRLNRRHNRDDLFTHGFSAPQIRTMRIDALISYATGTIGRTGSYYQDLLSRGIIVPKEEEYISQQLVLNNPTEDLQQKLEQMPQTKGKIINWAEALEKMRVCRYNGKRVAVAFGNFDVGTEGHKIALHDFAKTTTYWGDLFVLVGEDRLVRLRKGPHRPYVPHQQRMEFVADQPGVGWVVPVVYPGIPNITKLSDFYLKLQKSLENLAHFRLIGDREDSYTDYLSQCNKANIILVYNDALRVGSATEEGERKFGNICKR